LETDIFRKQNAAEELVSNAYFSPINHGHKEIF
jgi:hypothetical protein